MTVDKDTARRFLFEQTDVRGEIVHLDTAYRDVITKHNYPPVVEQMLGEFLVAAVLLGTSIKFKGRLILQARSEGQIPLLMVETTDTNQVRGIARLAGEVTSEDFHMLFSGGTLVVTVDPEHGDRYQSVVPLEGASLSGCLEHYFTQSEQLNTSILLAADHQRAAGMLLQQLPKQLQVSQSVREQTWQHVAILGKTLKAAELLDLAAAEILQRLYVEETVRLLDPEAVDFACNCSRERTASALVSLGPAELEALFTDMDVVEMHCEFCQMRYEFDRDTVIEAIRGDAPSH